MIFQFQVHLVHGITGHSGDILDRVALSTQARDDHIHPFGHLEDVLVVIIKSKNALFPGLLPDGMDELKPVSGNLLFQFLQALELKIQNQVVMLPQVNRLSG